MESKKQSDKTAEKKNNSQIICSVKNCAYHDGDSSCLANQIAVGPTYASSAKDTVCATFKSKEL